MKSFSKLIIVFFVSLLVLNCSTFRWMFTRKIKVAGGEMVPYNCRGDEISFAPNSYEVCEKGYIDKSYFKDIDSVSKSFSKIDKEFNGFGFSGVNIKSLLLILASEKQSFVLEMKSLCKLSIEKPCDKEIKKRKLLALDKFKVLSQKLYDYLKNLEQAWQSKFKKMILVKKEEVLFLENKLKSSITDKFKISKELNNKKVELNKIKDNFKLKTNQQVVALTEELKFLTIKFMAVEENLKILISKVDVLNSRVNSLEFRPVINVNMDKK